MVITTLQTNSENKDFINLVALLDKDLAIRDGDEHSFYDQFNKIVSIKHVIVAYKETDAIGCGAIKEYEPGVAEIKRMYTLPLHRGKGVASEILTALERWAATLGFKKCILETGKKQPEAMALYTKSGYKIISNYGQYENVANSVCYEKNITV